tara:strand:- start:2961 stop:3236 length:276 start_codon:yes stop_codon:yes gene_type:complete
MYKITDYTKKQAKRLGVEVKPSTRGKKKIDVFKNGKRIASVGHKDYGDFPTFTKTRGKEYADGRRRLYKIRHEKTRHKKNTPSYWADQLLW